MRLFIILFIPIVMNSQSIQVNYEYEVPNGSRILYQLKANGDYSEYVNLKAQENTQENIRVYSSNKDFFVLKDFKENLLVSTDFLGKKRIIIKDSLKIMEWELLDDAKKNIMGFECGKAQTNFRGRNYIAYYAPDIKIQDGPWKFQGLPGLIMEIHSKDNEYHYQAIEVSRIPHIKKQEISYSNDDIYNWEHFKKLYITYIDNLIKYLKSEKEETGYSDYYKVDKPEIIYKKAQTGGGIEF